jgi:hypothetical protein
LRLLDFSLGACALQVGQRVQDADGSLESLEKGFAAVANARVVKGAEEYYRCAEGRAGGCNGMLPVTAAASAPASQPCASWMMPRQTCNLRDARPGWETCRMHDGAQQANAACRNRGVQSAVPRAAVDTCAPMKWGAGQLRSSHRCHC